MKTLVPAGFQLRSTNRKPRVTETVARKHSRLNITNQPPSRYYIGIMLRLELPTRSIAEPTNIVKHFDNRIIRVGSELCTLTKNIKGTEDGRQEMYLRGRQA